MPPHPPHPPRPATGDAADAAACAGQCAAVRHRPAPKHMPADGRGRDQDLQGGARRLRCVWRYRHHFQAWNPTIFLGRVLPLSPKASSPARRPPRQDYCPFCQEHNQCDLTCGYPCADGAAAVPHRCGLERNLWSERRQVGPEVGPTAACSSCFAAGTHGPTCIVWARLTPSVLARGRHRPPAGAG
jgi:hypothetical protein